jgi:HSP20 family protein
VDQGFIGLDHVIDSRPHLDDMEVVMTKTTVEVRKTNPTRTPDAWHALRGEMDRLFDRFSGNFHLPSWRQMFKPDPAFRDEGFFAFSTPAVDMTEDEAAYKITAEVPGLEEKNIDVAVSGDVLTLKGEKRYEKDEKDKNRYMSERAYGSFQRSFALPDGVNHDKIAAELSKGVLRSPCRRRRKRRSRRKRSRSRPRPNRTNRAGGGRKSPATCRRVARSPQ